MLSLTITLNPDNPTDVEDARALLDKLATNHGEKSDDPSVIREKVVALLRGYGEKRTEYIRQVAQASPASVSQEDLIAVIGSAKAIGGTHSAIERAWRAKGMTTTFISTDANGDSTMDLDLADIVLHVLHDQVDEPDPLNSARF
jgi:hypothetical protein